MLRALPDINHVALADFKEKLKYRPLQHIILFCKLKNYPIFASGTNKYIITL